MYVPIEAESLTETENALSKKRVDSYVRAVLVDDCEHAIAEDQCDESVISFDAMFNVDCGIKVEILLSETSERRARPFASSNKPHWNHATKEVDANRNPYQAQACRVFDMNGTDPNCAGNDHDTSVHQHCASNSWDPPCHEDEVACLV